MRAWARSRRTNPTGGNSMKFHPQPVAARHTCALGPVLLAATPQGLAGVWFEGQRHHPDTTRLAPRPGASGAGRRHARSWTTTSPARARSFDLPLDLQHGTAFQQSVWQALLAIPRGAHHQLRRARASASAQPAAVRAVGAAVGRNPVSVDRALPPRAGHRRRAHRLRRRAGPQDGAAAAGRRALTADVLAPRARGPRAWRLDFVLLAAIWGASFLFMRLAVVEFGALPTAVRARGHRHAVPAAAAGLARARARVLRRHWKQDRRRRHAQLGPAVRAVRVRAAVDHHRPVGHPQRHRAAVRRAGRLGLAAATGPTARACSAWSIGFAGVALLAWDEASFKPDAERQSRAAGPCWPAWPPRSATASRPARPSATSPALPRAGDGRPAASSAPRSALALPALWLLAGALPGRTRLAGAAGGRACSAPASPTSCTSG